MNTSKLSLSTTLVITLLVGLTISNAALAHGYYGRGGGWSRGAYLGVPIGLGIGLGLGYGYHSPYYGSPYYGVPYYGTPYYGTPYYPPVPVYYSVGQVVPVTYSEQGGTPQVNPQQSAPQSTPQSSPQAAQGAWWYYCVDAKGYYPYVNQCSGGWLRVSPQPAAAPDAQPTLNNSPTP